MTREEGEKCIVWWHDESAYNTSEDTPILWGEKGKLPIKPKGKGSSIMVSEFIEEKDGYLALSDDQYEFEVTNTDQDIEKSALAVLEIGEHREGYWNSDRFMEQVGKAVKTAGLKYPPSQGYQSSWPPQKHLMSFLNLFPSPAYYAQEGLMFTRIIYNCRLLCLWVQEVKWNRGGSLTTTNHSK